SAAQSASRSPVTPRLLVLMDLTSSASMGRLRPSAKRLELLSLAGSGRLELGHQVVGRRDLELARGLDVEPLHDAVVDDHRVALRALAHAEAGAVHLQADGAGEVTVAVGDHHDLVADALVVAPGLHHEGV